MHMEDPINNESKYMDIRHIRKNETNKEHDGAAIAIKNNIKHKIIDNLEESYLACTIVNDLYELCVGTGYQPPRRPAMSMENVQRILRRNIPAIFVGDMNVKCICLGHTTSNAGERSMKQLIDRGNIKHIPTDFDTWMSAVGRGKPDIILTDQHNFLNIAISAGPSTTSDHIPIIIQLVTSPIMIPTSHFDFNKANWDKFREELSGHGEIDIDNRLINVIDEETDKWFTQVIHAMETNVPKINYRTIPYPQNNTNRQKAINSTTKNINKRNNGSRSYIRKKKENR